VTAEEERRIFNEVRNLPRERFGPVNLSSAQFDAVMTHLQWGELSAASRQRQALRQLAEQTHHHSAVQHSTAVEALFAMLNGRLQDALDATTASSLGSFYHVWRGRIARWLGDAPAVEEELARMDYLQYSAYAPGYAASMLAFLDRKGEAREAVESVLKVINATSPGQPAAYSMLSLALEGCALGDDSEGAAVLLERMRGDSRKLSKPTFVLVPRNLGRIAALLGSCDEARALYMDSLAFCESIGYRPELALTRLDLATLQLRHFPRERDDALRNLDLAANEFKAMSMTPAFDAAIALLSRGAPGTTLGPAGLSPRQAEVLRLLAEGKTTREIARSLVLSERTVERHIADVYAKIGARNRAEATAYALSRYGAQQTPPAAFRHAAPAP
jgi:DNA-binding CsgD family transcriptional regulator